MVAQESAAMTVDGPRVTRRKVLKTSLAALAVVGLGGVALAAQKTALLAHLPTLRVFDPGEYAILVALAERLSPAAGDGAPGATRLGIAEYFDAVLAKSDVDAQKAIKGALLLFENALGGALVGERLLPFTKLSPEQQDQILSDWRDSAIGARRTIFAALSSALLAFYWGNARTWKRSGYDGPPDVAGLREAYADNLVDLDALRATPLANGT